MCHGRPEDRDRECLPRSCALQPCVSDPVRSARNAGPRASEKSGLSQSRRAVRLEGQLDAWPVIRQALSAEDHSLEAE